MRNGQQRYRLINRHIELLLLFEDHLLGSDSPHRLNFLQNHHHRHQNKAKQRRKLLPITKLVHEALFVTSKSWQLVESKTKERQSIVDHKWVKFKRLNRGLVFLFRL